MHEQAGSILIGYSEFIYTCDDASYKEISSSFAVEQRTPLPLRVVLLSLQCSYQGDKLCRHRGLGIREAL